MGSHTQETSAVPTKRNRDMKDQASVVAKLKDHLAQSIGSEMLYSDSFVRLVHNGLVLHSAHITRWICGGTSFNMSGSTCCRNVRYFSPLRRSVNTRVGGLRLFLPKL
ncbi:hypothetical protein AVEN_6668-1 [Araneus ventricosus]|uniref:Uncharacterized protein n=1 Tax=Araneus ventricosus TaxID=182803 RepID=A0A4Y2Q4P9_ARAVE|nr:hypothetical protein AVEN_233819-1 [Araneus ventricosus]GBN59135.1 hypothetical protein AVEN_6668-1 [Araneus ventricosus]